MLSSSCIVKLKHNNSTIVMVWIQIWLERYNQGCTLDPWMTGTTSPAATSNSSLALHSYSKGTFAHPINSLLTYLLSPSLIGQLSLSLPSPSILPNWTIIGLLVQKLLCEHVILTTNGNPVHSSQPPTPRPSMPPLSYFWSESLALSFKVRGSITL